MHYEPVRKCVVTELQAQINPLKFSLKLESIEQKTVRVDQFHFAFRVHASRMVAWTFAIVLGNALTYISPADVIADTNIQIFLHHSVEWGGQNFFSFLSATASFLQTTSYVLSCSLVHPRSKSIILPRRGLL